MPHLGEFSVNCDTTHNNVPMILYPRGDKKAKVNTGKSCDRYVSGVFLKALHNYRAYATLQVSVHGKFKAATNVDTLIPFVPFRVCLDSGQWLARKSPERRLLQYLFLPLARIISSLK